MHLQLVCCGNLLRACVQSCRSRLVALNVADDEVSECLCSVLLLEDYTTEQLFHDFLASRLVSSRHCHYLQSTSWVRSSAI